MKSCESRIAREKWNLQCMLGIVEVVATSGDGRNPLLALEACKDKLSTEFLERLARRPETFVLLQCSCKLGCDGHCECSKASVGGMTEDIWTDFGDEIHKASGSSWQNTHDHSSGGKKKCTCDGLPQVTTDLMVRFRRLAEFQTELLEKPESILSSLLKNRTWRGRSWWKSAVSQESPPLPAGELLLSDSEVCLKTLSLGQELLYSLADNELGPELPHFGLMLFSYLILNLATQRSFGYLNAYLPDTPEMMGDYSTSRNPMKQFLAQLVHFRQEIGRDHHGLKLWAFCIDLAKIACHRYQPYRGSYMTDPIASLGQAMIFASFFGGGAVPKMKEEVKGLGSRSGEGGCLEVMGRRLKEFKEHIYWPVLDETKIGSWTLYRILNGKIHEGADAYHKQGVVLQKDLTAAADDGVSDVGGNYDWLNELFEDKKSYDLGSYLVSKASADPLYWFERMEDLYEYRRPSSEGWRQVLSHHPYLHDEIQRPRECEYFHLPEGERDFQFAKIAKVYFDRLPEVDGMRSGWRKAVSSRFLPKTLAAVVKTPLQRCQNSEHPPLLSVEKVKALFERRFEYIRSTKDIEAGALMQLEQVEERFKQIIEEFASKSSAASDASGEALGGGLLMNDGSAATLACQKLLDHLDYIEYIHFGKLLSKRRRRKFNLYFAEPAKHYRLSGDEGVEVLNTTDMAERGGDSGIVSAMKNFFFPKMIVVDEN